MRGRATSRYLKIPDVLHECVGQERSSDRGLVTPVHGSRHLVLAVVCSPSKGSSK